MLLCALQDSSNYLGVASIGGASEATHGQHGGIIRMGAAQTVINQSDWVTNSIIWYKNDISRLGLQN